MLHYKKHLSVFLLAFVVLFMASCNANEKEPIASNNPTIEISGAEDYFIIPIGAHSIVIDQNGNEIMQGEHLTLLTHFTSNSLPLYICEKRYEKIDENEYGAPISKTYSTLYYTNGSLAVAETECLYKPAFGKYVLQTNILADYAYFEEDDDAYYSNIIDPATGDVLYENVKWLSFLEDDVIALYNKSDSLVAIVNTNGEVLAGGPFLMDYKSIQKYGNYYIVAYAPSGSSIYDTTTWIYQVWDETFAPATKEYDQISYTASTYFITYNDADYRVKYVLDASTGNVVFQEKDLVYYDDDLYIKQTNVNDQTINTTNHLYRTSGELLVSADYLTKICNEDSVATSFCIIEDDTGFLYTIDRNGNEIARNETIFATNVSTFLPGLVAVEFYQTSSKESSTINIVNENLTVLLHGKSLSYMPYYFSTSANAARPYEIVQFYTYSFTYDVIDLNGNVLIDNVLEVYDYSNEYLVIEKGFYVGLVDLNGNWVYKTSRFNGTIDDETFFDTYM